MDIKLSNVYYAFYNCKMLACNFLTRFNYSYIVFNVILFFSNKI